MGAARRAILARQTLPVLFAVGSTDCKFLDISFQTEDMRLLKELVEPNKLSHEANFSRGLPQIEWCCRSGLN